MLVGWNSLFALLALCDETKGGRCCKWTDSVPPGDIITMSVDGGVKDPSLQRFRRETAL